jgi:uncharacterized protein (DUF4213/DUF364 family)
MKRGDMLQEAKKRFVLELESRNGDYNNLNDEVVVTSPLSSREAIGEPDRDDLPLLRGKEVLMQAVYRGFAGQAFTSASGSFQGSLEEVMELPLQRDFKRAVFVSTMNAVLRRLGLIFGTVHCMNDGPRECALRTRLWVNEQGADKVGLVGMQPALLESLVNALGPERVMVSDLAETGNVRCGVRVLDGMESSQMFEICQLVLITGSTLVNGTIDGLMEDALRYERRVVFYGTTIAGAAYLLGLERLCFCSK